MFLSDLIEWLEAQDPDTVIKHGFGKPDSYRGYYEDLAFEPADNVTIGSMLAYAKSAMNRTFQGYKSGDYTMGELTECWIAKYGRADGEVIGKVLLKYWATEGKP